MGEQLSPEDRLWQNTPLGIEILMHYHVTNDQYRDGDFDAPAVRACIDDFVQRGLLHWAGASKLALIGNREALAAYVNALCKVSIPIQRWVVP